MDDLDVEDVVGKISWNEGSAARSRVTHFHRLGKTPVNLIGRRWVFLDTRLVLYRLTANGLS